MAIEEFKNDTENVNIFPREENDTGYSMLPYEEKRFYIFESQDNIDESKFYYTSNALIIRKVQSSFLNNTIKKDANGKPYILAKFLQTQDVEQINKLGEKGTKEADRVISSMNILTRQYIDLDKTQKVLWLSESPDIDNANTFYRIISTVIERPPISLLEEAQKEDVSDNEAQVNIEAINTKIFNRNLQNYSEFFTDDNDPLNKNDLSVSLEHRALIGVDGIQIAGTKIENDKILKNYFVDVKLNAALLPIKVSINEIKDNKILYHMDWFDDNIVFPSSIFLPISNSDTNFINGVSLRHFDFNNYQLHSEDWKIISDMILLTYGFLTNFKFADRYVASDNEVQDNPSLLGKIKEQYICGYGDYKIFDIQNQDPSKYIQNVFDEYIMNRPEIEYSTSRYSILKSLIIALNNFIATEALSFGRTKSRFNEFYLPWFLALKDGEKIYVSSLGVLGLDGVNKTRHLLDPEIKFILKSIYLSNNFNRKKKCFPTVLKINFPFVIFNNKKTLHNDSFISLPVLDEELKQKDKYSNVGDIITNTNDDVNFIFYTTISWIFENKYIAINEKKVRTRIPIQKEFSLSSYNIKNPSNYGNEFWDYNNYLNFEDFLDKQSIISGIECDVSNQDLCDYEIITKPTKILPSNKKDVEIKDTAYRGSLFSGSLFIKRIYITNYISYRELIHVGRKIYSTVYSWNVNVEFRRQDEVIKRLKIIYNYDKSAINIKNSIFNWESINENTIPFGKHFTIPVINKIKSLGSDRKTTPDWYRGPLNSKEAINKYMNNRWKRCFDNDNRCNLDDNLDNTIYSGKITLELEEQKYSNFRIHTYNISSLSNIIDKNTIFDFNDWNEYCNIFNSNDKKPYTLIKYKLELLKSEDVFEINYINVKQIFAKNMIIHSKGKDYPIDLSNQSETTTSFEIIVV